MRGDSRVIDFLNAQLTQELTSVDQYVVPAAMFANWGYAKLHDRIAHEADDERGHVVGLVDRILYLEGMPDVASRNSLAIGTDPRSMIENDLKYEIEVARSLNAGIALCREVSDNGTLALLEGMLTDTERDHILWLQTQLHTIDEIGLKHYLAKQL